LPDMTDRFETARCETETATGPVILLADDEEVVRSVGRDILHILGYRVLLASNGVEAISVFQQHRKQIGLVILDWYMPGISGLEVLQKIWSIDHKAKVLIASGLGPPREMEDIERTGHRVCLLQKPYLVKDLQSELSRLLGKQ